MAAGISACATEEQKIIEFLLDYFSKQYDINTIDGKKKIADKIFPFIIKYPSSIEQQEYIKYVVNYLKLEEKAFRLDLVKTRLDPNLFVKEKNVSVKKTNFLREQILLGLILNYPQFYAIVEENLIEKIFLNEKIKKFYKIAKDEYNLLRNFNVDEFFNKVSEKEKEEAVLWQLYAEERYGKMSDELIEQELKKIVHEINKTNLAEIKQKLIFDLKEAKLSNPEKYLLVLNQYNQILKLKI